MHPSNPPPLNNNSISVNPPKRNSTALEPYASHLIASVVRDLQFLRQQGYISFAVLEEIIERLPKPSGYATPHTPPAPSPSSSPIPQQKSPTTSIKSVARNSTSSTPQRPLSASSQTSQKQQQQQQEQPPHSLTQDNTIEEVEEENQEQSQEETTIPSDFPIPPQTHPQLQRNEDVVNAGQPQPESTPKPAIPSRDSVHQPSPGLLEQPYPSTSITTTTTTGGTGAILATRPLPLPPNTSTASPPRPQALPVFNSKQEEAEYEKSRDLPQIDTALPAYSLAIVEAMWDFNSVDVGDLSFSKGDIIEVVEYVNMDWWRGRTQGTSKIGIFPKIYTKILPTQVTHPQVPAVPDQSNMANMANNTVYYQRSNTLTSYPTRSYQSSVQQQNNYSTYNQSVYANNTPNVSSQHPYLNTRVNTSNSNQQYFHFDS